MKTLTRKMILKRLKEHACLIPVWFLTILLAGLAVMVCYDLFSIANATLLDYGIMLTLIVISGIATYVMQGKVKDVEIKIVVDTVTGSFPAPSLWDDSRSFVKFKNNKTVCLNHLLDYRKYNPGDRCFLIYINDNQDPKLYNCNTYCLDDELRRLCSDGSSVMR